MKDRLSSLALRRIRTHLQHPAVLASLTGAALILGLSGPFGTFEGLPILPRLAYWVLTVAATYLGGVTVVLFTETVLPSRWPEMLRSGVAGAVAGLPVAAIVSAINLAWFENYDLTPGHDFAGLATLVLYCMLISATVSAFVGHFGILAAQQTQAQETPTTAPVPLLDRLPFDKRGALVSLQAQDHYVMVTTTKGQELVFMRISDAMREVGPTCGFQTHRSHWVARDQVTAGKQLGERGVLTLSTGGEVPVSRSYLKAVKAEGFI